MVRRSSCRGRWDREQPAASRDVWAWMRINAIFSTTYEIDEKHGTEYHQRFKKWLKYVQENDLCVAGAMTDVKGNRGVSPSKQADPDMFVHIVERQNDGIVIRGAKANITGTANSHEMLLMPTLRMREEDKDYAVSAAPYPPMPGDNPYLRQAVL